MVESWFKLRLSFLLFTVLVSGLLQAQWIEVPSPIEGTWFSVHFPNTTTGFVTGVDNWSYGHVAKSTDGGESWTNILTIDTNLYTIFFINPDTGYTAGSFGMMSTVILKTIDGGNNWTFSYAANSSKGIKSLFFLDADTGYAVGNGIILKTINGGVNWISQPFPFVMDIFTSVYFVNTDLGYVVGDDGSILKTNDGGTTWVLMYSTLGAFYSVYFVNADTGHVVGYRWTGPGTGHALIAKTIDGGVNWNFQVPSDFSALNSICFVNKNVGYIVSSGGKIQRTTNGGSNWSVQFSSGHGLSSVYFIDSLSGFAVGSNIILKTTNGGLTWVEQKRGEHSFKAYPNPVKDEIYFENPNPTILEYLVSIMNSQGCQVVSEKLNLSINNSIDVKELRSGLYFLFLQHDRGNYCRKFIIVK